MKTLQELEKQVDEQLEYEVAYYQRYNIPLNYQKSKMLAFTEVLAKEAWKDLLYLLNIAYFVDYAKGKELDNIGSWYSVTRFYSGGKLNDDVFRKLVKFAMVYRSIQYITMQEIETKYNDAFPNQIGVTIEGDKFVYYLDENLIDDPLVKALIEKKLLITPQLFKLQVYKKPKVDERYLVYVEKQGQPVNTSIFASFYGEVDDTIKVRWREETDKIIG